MHFLSLISMASKAILLNEHMFLDKAAGVMNRLWHAGCRTQNAGQLNGRAYLNRLLLLQ